MTSNSSIIEIATQIGEDLRNLRLQSDIDRQTLCKQAGVSLSALRRLESGERATLVTLIKVVRALGRNDWFSNIAPKISINPLHMPNRSTMRRRASKRKE